MRDTFFFSRHVAEDLEQYRLWQPRLHDLGECEVKHGVHVHVFNLYADEVGNRDVPAKLKPIAQEPAGVAKSRCAESRYWHSESSRGFVLIRRRDASTRQKRS
jgi:hypothetical protein